MSSKRIAQLHERIQFYEKLTDAYEKHLQTKNRIINKQIYRIADLEKQIIRLEHCYKGEIESQKILIALLKGEINKLKGGNLDAQVVKKILEKANKIMEGETERI